MPPRKTFLIRHVRIEQPNKANAARYLRVWHAGDLWNHPDTFPRITSEVLFGNDRPLEMEVGCSTGEYLCSLAQATPDHNFLGVEINLKSLHLAVHNAATLGLDNILFIKVPIQSLYQLIPPDALSSVYMHFPDPYLHPKYRTRRMFTPEFLDKMYVALVPGGKISIVTDKEELFWDMLAIVEREPRFEKTHTERYLTGFEPRVKSRYQEYWEKHDSVVYRFEVRKVMRET